MNIPVIIIASIAEMIALFIIVRLWRRHTVGISARIFWSFFLLVPVIGLAIYGLIHADPGRHPIKSEDSAWAPMEVVASIRTPLKKIPPKHVLQRIPTEGIGTCSRGAVDGRAGSTVYISVTTNTRLPVFASGMKMLVGFPSLVALVTVLSSGCCTTISAPKTWECRVIQGVPRQEEFQKKLDAAAAEGYAIDSSTLVPGDATTQHQMILILKRRKL